ncbi:MULTISPECIES: M48 family metalloprotease [Polaromonas]|uniref:M48 family metalloprotease n=1 Tax=Polaromonas aquatica TaxID=332657 RepID=A0ABW1U657_9BURK
MTFPQICTTLALLACLAPVAAQNNDAANALNLFQNLLRGGQPAPAAPQPTTPAGLAGGLLNGLVPGAAGAQAARPGAQDLVQLLSQSLEQIDEPKEIQIGRQLAAMLLGSKPLYPDMAMQRYVNQLGRWISLQSSRPDLPWTFAVLDDPGYNAFAAPGGYVFVTRGLLDRVADESELAGILAHEITHVTARHHLIAMNKAARTGLLTQVISSQLKNDIGGMVSSQLLTLGRNIYTKGLDQDDELDADRTGVALATRAGFDPYGLVAVLQQLRTAAPDDALFALSLSTHPPAQLRLNQLELAMGNRLDEYAGQPAITVAQRMSSLAAVNRRSAAQAPTQKAPPAKKKN